jgi:segregation and condensation protein A
LIAARALTPKPVVTLDLSHITPIRVSVAEAIATVMALLAERPSVTFREITKNCETRIDKVVRFLAVLELIKRGHAEVDQTENFGEITVRRGSGEARTDVGAVDEYEGVPIQEPEVDG